jgi:hypothetical protein
MIPLADGTARAGKRVSKSGRGREPTSSDPPTPANDLGRTLSPHRAHSDSHGSRGGRDRKIDAMPSASATATSGDDDDDNPTTTTTTTTTLA